MTDNTKANSSDAGSISDGYHTFDELYEHRHALFLALMRSNPGESWLSRRHDDGTVPFGDPEWFIAGMTLPGAKPITYHLPVRLWDDAVRTGAAVLERAPEWDGHSPQDVVERMMQWVRGMS